MTYTQTYFLIVTTTLFSAHTPIKTSVAWTNIPSPGDRATDLCQIPSQQPGYLRGPRESPHQLDPLEWSDGGFGAAFLPADHRRSHGGALWAEPEYAAKVAGLGGAHVYEGLRHGSVQGAFQTSQQFSGEIHLQGCRLGRGLCDCAQLCRQVHLECLTEEMRRSMPVLFSPRLTIAAQLNTTNTGQDVLTRDLVAGQFTREHGIYQPGH